MMACEPDAREAGFTLVEMLVALALFAVIAGGALVLLRFSVDAELASAARTEQIAQGRRFLSIWTADLGQAVPRPARDRTGALRPALEAGTDNVVLRLTRSGWTNPDGAPRAGVQKVEYRFAQGQLIRAGYPYADGAVAEAGTEVLASAGPPSLRFRMRDGLWRDRWEPQREADLPVAIELTVPQPSGEALRIISLVGVGYR